MSEQTEQDYAKDLLDKPQEFDARAFIRGASVAHDKVTVLTDGRAAWELARLEDELGKAEALVHSLSAGSNGSIADSEGHDEAEAEVAALKEQEAALVEAALASKMTFHLRGVGRKQVKLIDKKWRKAVKPPVRNHFPKGDDGDAEFEGAVTERNIELNDRINFDLVATSIYKVTDAEGNEDTGAWTVEDVEALADNLYDSEWFKLLNLMKVLTFSESIFSAAVERDADFLSKR